MKYLVTSALPYVNNIPHLGNLVCVISADVYARVLRLANKEVISVLGTDEHGTTTEVKALEENTTPKEICEKYRKIHKEIYDYFECSPDCFGSTSSKENYEVTKDIFTKLDSNGYILQDTIKQLYCENDKRFLSDRYVMGTCPFCGYENARGDQCEKCGKLLDATELIDPKCKICGEKPIIKESKHLFLDLKKLQSEIEAFFNKRKSKWTENAVTMTKTWLLNGLDKRCITRDLKWGIPVNKKGYETKVFYSWFDAPIGYIGITKQNLSNWKSWWHDDENVKLIQFMGKDNILFHTILFPAILLGTKDKYTLLDEISVNEYLNFGNRKFSKSSGIGVNGKDAMELAKFGITSDMFRYYLMVNRPEKSDTSFEWDDFFTKINTELIANLGNLVYRTVSFVNRFYDSKVPEGKLTPDDLVFLDEFRKEEERIVNTLEKIELKEGLKQVMKLSKRLNHFFQEKEPWKNIKDKSTKKIADNAIFMLVNLIKDIAILIKPFMPGVYESIIKMLNVSEIEQINCNGEIKLSFDDLSIFSIPKEHKLNDARVLFKKLDDKLISEIISFVSSINEKKVAGGNVKNSLSEKEPNIDNKRKFFADLRVAKIIFIEDHPNADKLYHLRIDLGSEERELVAGLKKYYSKDELLGRKIIVVANLKSVKLRGIESQGMLLAAEDDKGNVKLLMADDSELGSKIVPKGVDTKIPKDKINIDEFLSLGLVVENGFAVFEGSKLTSEKEDVTCEIAFGKVR